MSLMEIKQTETFRTWEAGLKDRRARTIIATRLMRLSEGLLGDAPSMGAGVRELRIHYGPGYRIYFQKRGNMLIVLLCGGDKGSQPRDIETAKNLAQNLERMDD
jgi:putative addiction module killer protein